MALFPGRKDGGSGGGTLVDIIDFELDPPPSEPEQVPGESASCPLVLEPDFKYLLKLRSHALIIKDVGAENWDSGAVYNLSCMVGIQIEPGKRAEPEYDPESKTWIVQEHGASIAVMTNFGTQVYRHVDTNGYSFLNFADYFP